MASVAQELGVVTAQGSGGRPPALFWAIAGLLFVALFAGYWLFIRTAYVPLLTNVAPQDAADIVKVLDERKVAYRLADEGRTILVASDQADSARLELAGSELPMRGQVGFELFNQSDMGLTEFAQKINYQRALQGELARTILLLHGIEAVRVHLGLPERGVFRDEQAQPKASVTLILKPGTTLTESTVAGIQRMVAGAVPEMRVDNVSVLDGAGRVVSSDAVSPFIVSSGSDAVLENYRARIVSGIARYHPGLRYDLNLSVHPLGERSGSKGAAAQGLASGRSEGVRSAPRGEPDFAISVRVTTLTPLDEGQRLELLQLIRMIIGYDPARGDAIQFLVGGIVSAPGPGALATKSDRVVARATNPMTRDRASGWGFYWPFVLLAGAALLIGAWLQDRRRSARRKGEQLTSFAQQLRERLDAAEGQAA